VQVVVLLFPNHIANVASTFALKCTNKKNSRKRARKRKERKKEKKQKKKLVDKN